MLRRRLMLRKPLVSAGLRMLRDTFNMLSPAGVISPKPGLSRPDDLRMATEATSN